MNDRETLKARTLAILGNHRGTNNPITMMELHALATGETIHPGRRYNQTRFTRSIIRQLRMEGQPICNRAGIGGGYFLAESNEELDNHLTHIHKRAISSLTVYQGMKHLTVTQMVQQLELDLNQQLENPENE